MPRISGRSGNVLVCPIRRKPSARNVARFFGLLPISERTCVTVMVGPVRTGFTRLMRFVEVLPDAAFSAAASARASAAAFWLVACGHEWCDLVF